MQSIRLRSHVGSDGILHLEVPVGVHDAELEVTVTLEVVTPTSAPEAKTPEELGWSPDFLGERLVFWEGEPLVREPQGEYEQRDELP